MKMTFFAPLGQSQRWGQMAETRRGALIRG